MTVTPRTWEAVRSVLGNPFVEPAAHERALREVIDASSSLLAAELPRHDSKEHRQVLLAVELAFALAEAEPPPLAESLYQAAGFPRASMNMNTARACA